MPKRISYHVVYATSEDNSYPACELNTQSPAARGWRSVGPPPHELLVRLTHVARVHRLQLLAHHQLIPSSIEVLVSGGLVSEGAATPCGATYTSVGKVTLATPVPQAMNRELRSAALPEPTLARFIKLKISGPHPPAKETDQVALMAINVLGEEISEDVTSPDQIPSNQPYSPYDDLSFVMYVDSEIAELIRTLDLKKKEAVKDERFEYARRLKSASSSLTAAGIRIGRWRLRKRQAASRDDFELARRMRDRISDALTEIKEDAELCRLFESDGLDNRNDASLFRAYDFSHHLSPSVAANVFSMDVPSPLPPQPLNDFEDEILVVNGGDDFDGCVLNEVNQNEFSTSQEETIDIKKIEEEVIIREADSPRRSVTPNASSVNNGVLYRRRNKSAGPPRSTFEAYEESVLPTLRHSHTNEYLRDTREDESSCTGSTTSHQRPIYKLNEKERKLAALPIIIFGYPLVEKFYSKNFLDKEEGLAQLRSELTSPSSGTGKTSPNKTARATAQLLQRSLKDKVYSVYCQANEIVRTLFQEFMPDRVCTAEISRCLEKLLPELLKACGDPAPRVHSMAQHTVLTIAECPHVRSLHIIPQQLVRPVAASMHPRLALSRLQMLEQLIQNHGISTEKNSGLTVRRLAECGAAGVQHASGAVRAAAERILLSAYAKSPRLVRTQLPPDDAVTRRNLIYRHLFQQFDKIDTERRLNAAPSEDQLSVEQTDSNLETMSISQSTRSGVTSISGSTSFMSSLKGSSLRTSTYSLKSMSSCGTLAPSVSSMSSTRTKSSLKKTPSKKYGTGRKSLDIGYNKLRLDSAVSPKHTPKTPNSEKVHFQDQEEVVLRRTQRNQENRHSMIHYDHEPQKPILRERPLTVYDYSSKESIDSKQSDVDSPRSKSEFFRDSFDSPREMHQSKSESHLRSFTEDANQMDESGYYSPGDSRRIQARDFDYDGGAGDLSSDGTTPEPYANTCSWCSRKTGRVNLEVHYRKCVVLADCIHCHSTVEARSLHSHLLESCTMSEGSWKKCQKCNAALRIDKDEYHVNCIPLSRDEWKCPYCLTNVLARDLPWQRHLTQCSKNPRNKFK